MFFTLNAVKGMTVKMNINKIRDNETLTMELNGRLDTMSTMKLEAELKKEITGVKTLIFDFANVEYISSAGLRVLLLAQKVMNRQGKMVLRNVSRAVMEVFEFTEFSDILTIE